MSSKEYDKKKNPSTQKPTTFLTTKEKVVTSFSTKPIINFLKLEDFDFPIETLVALES